MNIEDRLRHERVVIVTHEYATGPSHALEIYLIERAKKIFFIAHPFVFARDRKSHYRLYQNHGVLTKENEFFIAMSNQILSVIKDMILSLFWILAAGRFDIFIGVDSTNTFIGILLKKIGFVKKVVFYVIDYVPNRFENKMLNKIYHSLDRFAVKYSDFVWNVSPIMVAGREKRGVRQEFRKKQIVVPVGTEMGIKQVPFDKIKRFHVAHMGHLIKKQGVQLLIEALPDIIKRIPQFHADIIGGGDYEVELKALANKLSVSKSITFYGFIKSHDEVEKLLSYCALGIAPYLDIPDSYVRYADPGKVKAYLAAGLPVIITKVPAIAFELERRKCGIAINYDKDHLVDAIIKLLADEIMLKDYRKNAYGMGRDYRWNKVFNSAFRQSL